MKIMKEIRDQKGEKPIERTGIRKEAGNGIRSADPRSERNYGTPGKILN